MYSVGALGLGDHPEAVRAAGALLSYIRETQKTDISHITRIGYLEEDEVMALGCGFTDQSRAYEDDPGRTQGGEPAVGAGSGQRPRPGAG